MGRLSVLLYGLTRRKTQLCVTIHVVCFSKPRFSSPLKIDPTLAESRSSHSILLGHGRWLWSLFAVDNDIFEKWFDTDSIRT